MGLAVKWLVWPGHSAAGLGALAWLAGTRSRLDGPVVRVGVGLNDVLPASGSGRPAWVNGGGSVGRGPAALITVPGACPYGRWPQRGR
jgi:hypothetical protein